MNKIKKIMKKKLAIKGHQTKGKEVIEILEILGGKNEGNCEGKNPLLAYYIDDRGEIDFTYNCDRNENILRYTLEEFLEKYPYKIGDMIKVPEFESEVRINDMKWDGYNIQYEVFTDETEWYTAEELNNWNTKNIKKGPEYKIGEKVIYDGDVVEITKCHHHIDQYIYYFYHNGVLRSSSCHGLKSCEQVESKKINQNPILQQLKKYFEETPRDVIEKEWNELSYLNEIGPTVEEYLESVKKYRQTQYPKTYEECHELMVQWKEYDCNPNSELILCDAPIHDFCKLIVARNIYWKIAGEQMGLGKPWEPDWKKQDKKYIISVFEDTVIYFENETYNNNTILAFPTAEMRDAFYENFKDLIEICKEFI